MNESLRIGKRALTLAVAAATILWSVGFAAFVAPLTASAFSAGDLIKGPTLTTVYYYGADGNRYAFTNEKNFYSWFTDFSTLQNISDAELAAIPLGGNIVNRPGSFWVKITSDAKTYAVTPQGQIRWIENQTVAEGLAGADWNQFIIDVADVYFTDYNVGVSLTSATSAYNGALVLDGSERWLVWDGEKRMITDAGWTANRFQTRFLLDGTGIDLSTMPTGSSVTGPETVLRDAAQLGLGVTGGLNVSLASDTPASATIPAGASSVPFTKWRFQAVSGSADVSQLVVSLGGIGGADNIDNVYLYEGSVRMTDGRSINSSTRQATFSALNMSWADGESSFLTARVDVSLTPTPGDTANLGLADASHVVSSASVSGSFPLTGNTMTFSGTEAGTLTIEESGSIANPTLGQDGAVIARHTVEADGEDAWIEQITYNVDDAQDHSNYMVWMGDEVISNCDAPVGDLVPCGFPNLLFIEDGDSENLRMTADVAGEGGDTISVAIEEPADVLATGGDFGFGLRVDIEGYDDTSCASAAEDCSFSTIVGGELTFAFNGPPSGDIQIDGDDEVLMNFTITSENFVEIQNVGLIFTCESVNECLHNGDDDRFLEALTIRRANGSTWMGPEEFVLADNGDDQGVDFTDTQILNAGDSEDLVVSVDVNADTVEGSEYSVTIDMNGDGNGEDDSDTDGIEAEDINGDALAAADIIPGSDIIGNTFTAMDSSLDVNAVTPPSDATYVKGSNGVTVVGHTWAAGDTSDVTLTDLTMSVDSDLPEDAIRDHVSTCSLYDSQSGALIDGPESVTVGDQILFENFVWTVAAGETGKTLTKCNFSRTDTEDSPDDYWFFIADDDTDIIAEDEDGDSVGAVQGLADNSGGGVTTISIVDTGSLAFRLSGSTPFATIVLGNSTGVSMSTFIARASTESFVVSDLTLINCVDGYEGGECSGTGEDDAMASVMLSYKDEAGADRTRTVFMNGGLAEFGSLELWAPQDTDVTFSARVDTNNVSEVGAQSGSAFSLDLTVSDVGAEFEAVGAASGDTLTTADYAFGDAGAGALDVCEATTDGACDAGSMVLRKTKPTLSFASSNISGGAASPGFNEVLHFTVGADSRGSVTLEQIVFRVTAQDSVSGWSECDGAGSGFEDPANWSFYDINNPSNPLDDDGDWAFFESTGDTCGATETPEWAELTLSAGATPAEEIGAGDANTYVVKVDSAGAVTDDSLRLDIPSETEADVDGLDALNWLDGQETPDNDGIDGRDDDDAFECDSSPLGADTCINALFVKTLPMSGNTYRY